MSVEELLKPRYKVIADYPCNPSKVGDIFYKTTGDNFQSKTDGWSGLIMDRYPHLFKKLEWYEDREVSEMPEYVKRIDGSEVFQRVFRYEGGGSIMVKFPKGIYGKGTVGPIGLLNVLPATKEEYDSFIKLKK